MKRITPGACLLPLTGTLAASFALSIGLTFQSDRHCYAGVCGEWLFPLQARLHVLVWYIWLSLSVTFLALRAFHLSLQRVLQKQLRQAQIPVVGKSFTISGAMAVVWILSLYGALIGIWWLRLQDYFVTRGREGGMMNGNRRVAAVALTGHLCDVTMGMVLLPVTRNSALASFFKLSAATTFAFHMIQAYLLFALVLIHGLLYASWAVVWSRNSDLSRLVFPLLNPTYLYHEVWPGNTSSLGIWRASLIFTGLVATLIMVAMFITTFPVIRRKHFNVFYFTHLLGIAAVIVICLHASTMFYCTAPGLTMWLLDWGMRLYELSGKVDSTLVALGKGWFCLTLPLPRRRLDGYANHSPLAHFHIHHTKSSIREIHPFTTITHLASQKLKAATSEQPIMVQFLFRTSRDVSAKARESEKQSNKQWTSKLASLVDEEATDVMSPLERAANSESQRLEASYQTSLRLEGPYFTSADPAHYDTVICLVAGTGVTGAIAIASAFSHLPEVASKSQSGMYSVSKSLEKDSAMKISIVPIQHRNIWKRCVVVWSVRESEYIDLPFFQVDSTPNLHLITHLTGPTHSRLNMPETIRSLRSARPGPSTWVYLSGPNAFIEAGERACREAGVDYFGAKWA